MYFKGKFVFDVDTNHMDILRKKMKNDGDLPNFMPKQEQDKLLLSTWSKYVKSGDMRCMGRVWKKYKAVSIWTVPDKKQLPIILKDLNKAFPSLKIDDDWYLDVSTLEFDEKRKIEKKNKNIDMDDTKVMKIGDWKKLK
jgi:hypothetical protein